MNRRGFFGTVLGAIAATTIGSKLHAIVKPEPPAEPRWGELWVQVLLDDGSTFNWVIQNPAPGFYLGPMAYRDCVVEKVTSSLLLDGKLIENPIGVNVDAMSLCHGDSLGLQINEFFMSQV